MNRVESFTTGGLVEQDGKVYSLVEGDEEDGRFVARSTMKGGVMRRDSRIRQAPKNKPVSGRCIILL